MATTDHGAGLREVHPVLISVRSGDLAHANRADLPDRLLR